MKRDVDALQQKIRAAGLDAGAVVPPAEAG